MHTHTIDQGAVAGEHETLGHIGIGRAEQHRRLGIKHQNILTFGNAR